ncbi:MAG: phenylalanine--tRNA ligase subunit beta [Rhodothermales bacterium]
MIISANWLSDYVEHGLSVDELADRLTMCGLEVDGVEHRGQDLDGVVIGAVVATRSHPDADRLTLCDVDLGSGAPVQIVCGASNVAAGQRVPVATVGTTLHLPSRENPEVRVPVTLKKAKLRGQESNGMICAEDELGLSDNHDGIMVLPDDAPVGVDFAEWMAGTGVALKDAAIDVAITPNRPDAVSHIGMARDIAALTDRPLVVPDVAYPLAGGVAAKEIEVDIQAPELCHRYVGVVVRGVTIAESPAWLKQRLTAIGLRPRNNVVDITNYVMYECGQPLHAFDLATIRDGRIRVHATSGETRFTTLDSKERILPAGTLMIADGEGDVAIAGVMGGENSEVSDATTDVLIESAWFDPSSIRRTAKTLQLQTDASYRFERGVDPTGQVWAAARAAELMRDLAGGTVVDGMVDAHPVPHVPRTVPLRGSRIERVVGTPVASPHIVQLLTAIGFELRTVSEDAWDVVVPAWRPDVEREIDVIEEVARLYGFDNIPEPAQSALPNFTPRPDARRELRKNVRMLLAGMGFREVQTNSMLPLASAERFMDEALPAGRLGGGVVETLNPITTEMSTLRPSLLPGVLRVVDHNRNHGQRGLRLFEMGRVHARKQTDRSVVDGYTEIESLLIVASGTWTTAAWNEPERAADWFDVKGVAERVLRALRLSGAVYTPLPDRSPDNPQDGGLEALASVQLGQEVVGTVGQVSGERPVFFVEFDWSLLADRSARLGRTRYEAVSRFPVVERDIALVMDVGVAAGDVRNSILDAGGDLLKECRPFDLYEGEHLPEGRKSVAFALAFSADRTLRDEEVDQAVGRILEKTASEFGARLR